MDAELVLYVGRRGLETALLLAAPVLIVTLVVGFIVAMLQAVTSIRDMTMGLVVKLACVAITLLICGGWMMQVAVGFAKEVFNYMQSVGH
jgi:flagellar biosynthetic protein FliQ